MGHRPTDTSSAPPLRGPAVLALDTAGPVVGVALVSPAHPDRVWTQRIVRGSDAVLLPAVAELLAALDARHEALGAVAVTVGPGAFTGLRVGLAAALGVAVARDVPVAPEDSLSARARLTGHRPLLSVLDARKGRFYGRWFGPNGALGPAVDRSLADLLADTPGGTVQAVGEGAHVAEAELLAHGVGIVARADQSPVAELGHAVLRGELAVVDAAQVVLEYVRPPDARRPTHLLVHPGSTPSH